MEIFEMNGVADSFVGTQWDCDCKQCGPLKWLFCKKTSAAVTTAKPTLVQPTVTKQTTVLKKVK